MPNYENEKQLIAEARAARSAKTAERVATVVIILALLVVALHLGMKYKREAEAREVLVSAEAIRTALHAVAIEHIATGVGAVADVSGAHGFANGVYERVIDLAMVEGELYVLRADKSRMNIEEFVYFEGGYVVRFKNSNTDSEDEFVVLRGDEIFAPLNRRTVEAGE